MRRGWDELEEKKKRKRKRSLFVLFLRRMKRGIKEGKRKKKDVRSEKETQTTKPLILTWRKFSKVASFINIEMKKHQQTD